MQRGSSAAPIRSCQVEQIQRLGKALIWYAAVGPAADSFVAPTHAQKQPAYTLGRHRSRYEPLCTRAMGVSFVLSIFFSVDAPSRARSNKTHVRERGTKTSDEKTGGNQFKRKAARPGEIRRIFHRALKEINHITAAEFILISSCKSHTFERDDMRSPPACVGKYQHSRRHINEIQRDLQFCSLYL